MKHPNAASTNARYMPLNAGVFKRRHSIGPVIYGPTEANTFLTASVPSKKLWQFDTLRALSYLRFSENPTPCSARFGVPTPVKKRPLSFALE